MDIKHLAKIIGLCDASHESAACAVARFALCELNPIGEPQRQDHIELLADVLEAYSYALQEAGIEINGDDLCKGDH